MEGQAPLLPPLLSLPCSATNSDSDMLSLLSIIEEGMPDHRNQLSPSLRDYHQFREHLYSVDGVVIYKGRIVIPPSLRPNSALHAAHQGVSSMVSRAEASIFGRASPLTFMPLEPIAVIVIRWHLFKLPFLQHHQSLQLIHSSVYALTILLIRG